VKKFLSMTFAVALIASMSFAQTGSGTSGQSGTNADQSNTTTTTTTTTTKKHHRKHHKKSTTDTGTTTSTGTANPK